MSKKKRPKWTTKLSVKDNTDEVEYPLSRCKHCPRRYHGLEFDSHGNQLREFACWDLCYYTNQREIFLNEN